eukprot:scaffold120854_cov39-Phaeocystis_antarctica.AAC.1
MHPNLSEHSFSPRSSPRKSWEDKDFATFGGKELERYRSGLAVRFGANGSLAASAVDHLVEAGGLGPAR